MSDLLFIGDRVVGGVGWFGGGWVGWVGWRSGCFDFLS